MGVESPTENQGGEELSSLQDTLGSEQITFVDTLVSDIESVIAESSNLHRYEYVIGEVTNYGVSSNDHVHFDLAHNGTHLHCVILQFRRSDFSVDLEDGLQVAIKGELSFYTADNYCSIMVEDGVLDASTKQTLPEYPQCIGIATSAESNAREDAVTSIHTRHPGVDIVIQDTSVQGKRAGQSMMQAIGALDTNARIDVIVLTRGGGSDTHLRVFNETALCRVIHNTQTPIVVGVGHESDRTLAEEVADHRVMTPTQVGDIVPDYEALTDHLSQQQDQLDTAYTQTVTTQLATLQQRLDHDNTQHVRSELTDLETTLDHAYQAREQQIRHGSAVSVVSVGLLRRTPRWRCLASLYPTYCRVASVSPPPAVSISTAAILTRRCRTPRETSIF